MKILDPKKPFDAERFEENMQRIEAAWKDAEDACKEADARRGCRQHRVELREFRDSVYMRETGKLPPEWSPVLLA